MKVIKNLKYVKSKNNMNQLSRGNFMTLNKTDLDKVYNKREEQWQEAQTVKQNKQQTKMDLAMVRN